MDTRAEAGLAAARIAELTGRERHQALVVLGSGWEPAVEAFGTPRVVVHVGELPGFTPPTAVGHPGTLASYDVGGVATLVLAGRTHLYEGHGLGPVVHGVRTAAAAGVRLAVLTNANGSLRPDHFLGQPVLVRDHLNLTGTSPLTGADFVDLTDCWSARLRVLAHAIDPTLAEGVYAWLPGPHYETPAEGEWLRRVGADLVGMSTVPEAIAARALGVEVLGLSTVTAVPQATTSVGTVGDSGGDTGIDPDVVVTIAEATASRLSPTVAEIVVRGVRP